MRMKLVLLMLDFLERIVSPLFGVDPRRVLAFRNSKWKTVSAPTQGVTWFHASSTGELEMLTPLIDDFIERKKQVGVSIFSPSAEKALHYFQGRAVFAGYSPSEKEWGPLFQHFKVEKLILAKYDFWPGLIHAAGARKIPLIIINAQWRKSFRFILRLFSICGKKLPDFYFSANSNSNEKHLAKEFPSSTRLKRVDPRYERVIRRSEKVSDSKAVLELKTRLVSHPRPWGIAGSVWEADLNQLVPALNRWNGTLIVVPHKLDPKNIEAIERILKSSPNLRYEIVAQMGVLTEIYSLGDWAFVGGGFHDGIHSTIEPAVFGIPVACGPNKTAQFNEVATLAQAGLLTVCNHESDLRRWLLEKSFQKMDGAVFLEKRRIYRELLEECLAIGVT